MFRRRFSALVIASTLVLPTLFSVATPTAAAADTEITLFDSDGAAEAYISLDDDLTVYLWDGTPAAFLTPNGTNKFNVYSFRGRHLGWLEHGVVWDHDGNAMAAIKQAFSSFTQMEPMKSMKQMRSMRSMTEMAPMTPMYTYTWSYMPLSLVLKGA